MAYPFPLRPGYLAQIVVPRDMSKAEADRLCAFVLSLATPQPETEASARRSRSGANESTEPVRCKDCDIPNGCPEYCRCKPESPESQVPAGGSREGENDGR
jgi:hypothetical protein